MKIEVYRRGMSFPDETVEIDEYDRESVKTGLEFIAKNKNENIQIVMKQHTGLHYNEGHDEFIIHDHLDFFEEMAKSENAENIKFRYSSGSSEFSLDKIIEDEKFIQTIANEIKEKQFSPLERMVAIYDMAQAIKPYVDEGKTDDSRTLHEYLNNNYMVCAGYANFIKNIGHMLGEHYSQISCNFGGPHARNYVNLVDDKYEVNGFYGLDVTNDNTYGKDASQRSYKYFLMETTEGRKGVAIEPDGITATYDEFFTYKDVEEFKKKIMSTKDFEALPDELKYTNELLSENASKKLNFESLKEQLRNLDLDFFKTFEQLDFNKDEDIQVVLDYLKGKINQPLDKQKIVDAKMVVEQSKYKNLSPVDIEDMRVDVSRQVKRTAYGKGFEQYIEQRWQDVKSQTAEEAQEENKFLNCKAIYNTKLRQALSEKVSIGNFIGTELRDIDYQYFPRIEQKEEQLTENGYTIDKEEAYLEYSDKELEEFGLKRNIKIKLPDPSEKLTMEEQIAFYEKAKDELCETLGLEQEQTKSPENLTQKLGKEIGIDIHNDTKGKQETNEEMIEEEKEIQNHLQEEQK